jgi:hypothetical protein
VALRAAERAGDLVFQEGETGPAASILGYGPPLHSRCVSVLMPLAERLATEEGRAAGVVPPEVLNRAPRALREESPWRGL